MHFIHMLCVYKYIVHVYPFKLLYWDKFVEKFVLYITDLAWQVSLI